ncbi:tRNA pseudouridine(55) synthase TruB [Microbacterium halophytorum]|uniref:tRNA pseudouridine(55) synthase TruB n=1 Tax=Microbacterium halophytorum TaxID=2067568 RepID=UPI000CFE0130|nr:tRNA pseudouridine(55) synthase TruB [Microbacterium halophytorum]
MTSGVLLVDKPQGVTSHDVVARTRRAFGTRKVGHAGTLDPMATGLLLIGIDGATRLLTYLVGLGKTYEATIRLGESTDSDDADGEITGRAAPDAVAALGDDAIDAGIAQLTGDIEQVPSAVSAIKVDGRRAYDRVRAGEQVELKARSVTVSRFERLATRRLDGAVELDVAVDCSSGTYIRALARDLGAGLGVGGHLTRLRRTRVGEFDVADAVSADGLDGAEPMAPADVAARAVGSIEVTAEQARDLRHGKRLEGLAHLVPETNAAAVDPSGALVGIVEKRGSALKSAMNMPENA